MNWLSQDGYVLRYRCSSTTPQSLAERGDGVYKFPTRGTRETFAARDISSVIALGKSENGSERTNAKAKIRKR